VLIGRISEMYYIRILQCKMSFDLSLQIKKNDRNFTPMDPGLLKCLERGGGGGGWLANE
jgi:hypothetical protein